jgi:hypothetical protein
VGVVVVVAVSDVLSFSLDYLDDGVTNIGDQVVGDAVAALEIAERGLSAAVGGLIRTAIVPR